MPRATRGLGSALRRPMEKKKKKKALSIHRYLHVCIQRKYLAEPAGYGTPIDDPIHPFHPSLERVLPV